MRSVSFSLDAGVDYLVRWLVREPSPISGRIPSFETESGRISIHSGWARSGASGDTLVRMDGTRSTPSHNDPSVERHAPNVPVIAFSLTPLSSDRTELVATCYEEGTEPFFEALLREITRRWRAAPSVSAEGYEYFAPRFILTDVQQPEASDAMDVEAAMASMTERQREMVRLWRTGKTAAQIANQLGDVEATSVNKRISELRKAHGVHVVPHHGSPKQSSL